MELLLHAFLKRVANAIGVRTMVAWCLTRNPGYHTNPNYAGVKQLQCAVMSRDQKDIYTVRLRQLVRSHLPRIS